MKAARRALVSILLLAAGVGAAQPAGAARPQDAPPIRVNVHLVNVFVNVTDEQGSIVGGLKKEDFLLTEDGRPQRIAVFERQSEMPLTMVLAIDTSGSVQKDLALEVRAAHDFVHALLRPQDQLSLLEFSTDVREAVPFTNRLDRIDRGLETLRGGPATALYNAIYLGSQSLTPREGRKVLVLISDGGNTVKGVDYAKALEEALRGEVMVYSIIDVPIEASAGRDTGGEHAMITLAEQTGGRYYYADGGSLAKVFQKVSDDLRTQYLLGYYPPRGQVHDSDFRRIDVKLTGSANVPYTLRHRTGYYASPSD